MARRRRLGGDRARQPSLRVSLERGARRVGGGDRCRRARRVDGLLGATVRDGGVGRGAAAGGDRGRRPPPSTPLHGGGLRVLRRTAPRPRPPTRTERPSWRPKPRYDPCEPGYATFIEALGEVYCGHLDRYVELTGTVAALPGAASQAYGIAAYLDGLQSAGRVDEALDLTDSAVAAARELGNPYWIAYTLWIVGLAFSKVDAQRALLAWDEGVEFVREHRVKFFEGFIGRDAARLHTSEGEPEAALALFGPAIESFHQAGNVPQLIITLASVPALFERVGRLDAAATLLGAISREPASFHHVPELVDLGDRLTEQLGEERVEAAHVGRREAGSQRCRGLRAGSRSSSLAGRSSGRHTTRSPGRPDSSRGRRAATDRGRARRRARSPRSCSSRRRPRTTTSNTSTRSSPSRTAPPRPAGPSSTS